MKLRALVIDDSRVMRHMVMGAVARTRLAEFEFTEAEDGADGLAKFDPRTIDIIFADWHMPKMSGIEFVRKVRTSPQADRVPIIMVTSERTMGKMEEALDRAGADAYVCKPFTVDELAQKLSKVLAGRRGAAPAAARGGFFSKLLQAGG
jgi:two-component system chemotaxis response regulator CheY